MSESNYNISTYQRPGGFESRSEKAVDVVSPGGFRIKNNPTADPVRL